LATYVFEFVNVLIRFWGQTVKSQGDSRQWPEIRCGYNIFVNILWVNFIKFGSHMYLGLGHTH